MDKAEHSLIDQLIDSGACTAGHNDFSVVHGLYRKGLVYFDVPIEESDCVSVPPLEGFVMNRFARLSISWALAAKRRL